jgi:pimeloyl-ACP methyl ester carboxylesterase
MFHTFSTDAHLSPVCQVVSDYISNEFGPESVNLDQLRTITKNALEYLKHSQDPSFKKWRKDKIPDPEQKAKIINAVQSILISAETPWTPTLSLESKIQALFLQIMRGNVPPPSKLLNEKTMLNAIVWKKNPEVLALGRDLLNKIFVNMFEEMNKKRLSSEKSFHMEIIIGDLLSLYPFIGPKDGEELKIPVKIDEKWELVTYNVQTIHLTPEWMGSPLVAFGLNAKTHPDAPPLLLFKGTTYPTDEGFSLSLLTDLNPGASVGAYVFRLGQQKIKGWLDTHAQEKKAIIYGKSLGGSQAWRTALYFPDQVQKVMSYSSPGFSSRDLKRLNHIQKLKSIPEINIFCQPNDPTPFVDKAAKEGVNYFQVVGKTFRKGVLAHADMFSTHERSTVMRLKYFSQANKWKRIGFSMFRTILSYSVFPVLFITHMAQAAVVHSTKRLRSHLFDRKVTKKKKV